MRSILIAAAGFLLAGTGNLVRAQVDPHVSQYYLYPHFMNPGMTGVMNGDLRVSGIHRNQWSALGTPYVTTGFTADGTTSRNLNIGVSILNQTAGDAGFRYTTGYLSVAYTGVRWGTNNEHQLSFGLQGGLISRRFDPSKLRMDDQWIPGIGYNPGLPTGDIFPVTNSAVLDMGAGVFYHNGSEDAAVQPYGGVSVFHLNRPADPFVSATDLPYIPLRLSALGGVRLPLSESITFIPHFLYLQQGTARELLLGAYGSVYVSENTDFLVGANYRINDAVTPFAGIRFGELTVGLSYDVTQSQLSRLTRGVNSLELSLSWLVKKPRRNVPYFNCPRF
ncbi:MAG TPA: PorP/SprF family type IX secretion system membrane protein [Lacibacter sp.]|nr:PorP/SprF family type IX secretion system membrane protein [Lacibacter sp.]HMO87811.1 PorP/SprF family type IX secretion system membrane protein [Lacibacter sp.]HMP87415.1 PorP/SprF family type IX secretion system membrane protein [Lacibacter sp.]